MRHGNKTRRPFVALAMPIAVAMAAPAAPAAAGDWGDAPSLRRLERFLDNPPSLKAEWMPGRLGLSKKHGVSYRQSLTVGDRPIELRLGGPVHRKRLGFGFRVDF